MNVSIFMGPPCLSIFHIFYRDEIMAYSHLAFVTIITKFSQFSNLIAKKLLYTQSQILHTVLSRDKYEVGIFSDFKNSSDYYIIIIHKYCHIFYRCGIYTIYEYIQSQQLTRQSQRVSMCGISLASQMDCRRMLISVVSLIIHQAREND